MINWSINADEATGLQLNLHMANIKVMKKLEERVDRHFHNGGMTAYYSA
jgi:hypothetical protein